MAALDSYARKLIGHVSTSGVPISADVDDVAKLLDIDREHAQKVLLAATNGKFLQYEGKHLALGTHVLPL